MPSPALPIALPFLTSALLAAVGRLLSRHVRDALAVAASVAAVVLLARLFAGSLAGPSVHWLGGWLPRHGVAMGLDLVVEPFGCGLALLAALLCLAVFVFGIHFFDATHGHFHALVLAFTGALVGFFLTGDLFELFVFLELMGAAAFALCGYKAEEPAPLQGALNFAIIHTIGAFFGLTGIALVYGRTGALNLAQAARALGTHPDLVVEVAAVFVVGSFLVKSAAVPFQLWLPDAYGVAPTPVSAIFAGSMTGAGVFAVAKTSALLFHDALGPGGLETLRRTLLVVGVLTALVGALMCPLQTHAKRLLAFSTVSHVGVMLAGLSALDAASVAGSLLYAVGHGLVKAALFFGAGILLHRFRTVEEAQLVGRGRRVTGAKAVFLAGGLALAGLPFVVQTLGESLLRSTDRLAFVRADTLASVFAGVLTGGAVLRFFARTFLGWGDDLPPGRVRREEPETRGPHTEVPLTMTLVPIALLVLAAALAFWPALAAAAKARADVLVQPATNEALVLDGVAAPPAVTLPAPPIATTLVEGVARTFGALFAAMAMLWPSRLPRLARALFARLVLPGLRRLRELQSGDVADYVAWLVAGMAALAAVAVAFR